MAANDNTHPDRLRLSLGERLLLLPQSLLAASLDLGPRGAFGHAAAISYYTILSVFPFLLFLVVVSTRLLSDPELSVRAIEWMGSYLPTGRQILLQSLPVLQRTSGTLGVFSIAGLAWSSMGLFTALRTALDQVMGTKAPTSAILTQWASLVALVSASFGLLLLIMMSTFLTLLGHVSLEGVSATISSYGPVAAAVASWLLMPAGMILQTTTLFVGQFMTWMAVILVLQLLPRHHPGISNCLVPALVVTVGVEFLKSGFLWSIQSRGNFTVINGPLAAAIAFMLWAYLTALILLFGAAWARHLKRLRGIAARRRVPDEYLPEGESLPASASR